MKTHNFHFRETDRIRFEEIRSGLKSIETRAAHVQYESVKEGDEILFTCGQDSFAKRVRKVYCWPTVEAMLAEVPLERIMPGLVSIEQAKSRYASYPGYPKRITEGGILGFDLY